MNQNIHAHGERINIVCDAVNAILSRGWWFVDRGGEPVNVGEREVNSSGTRVLVLTLVYYCRVP